MARLPIGAASRAWRLALATLAAALPGRAQDEPPAALTAFAWPVPSAATVVETVFKGGQESKTRYRLTMTRREGGGIRVRYSHFEFLEVAGMDATRPEMKEQLEAATALASAIPDLHVRADGTFEAATGLAEVMDKVVDFLAESRGWSNEEKEGVRANMQRGGMLDSLKASVGQYWRCWTGAWIGWAVRSGDTVQEQRELPVLGSKAAATVTLKNLGAPADHPQALSLELRVQASGRKFSAAMTTYVGDLLERFAGDAEPADVLPQLTFALDETFTVITSPRTLVPQVATTSRTVTAENRVTEEQLKEIERHRYEFTWDPPEAK